MRKFLILYEKLLIFLLMQIFSIHSHITDVRDTKVFEITLNDMNYDEESLNEMIQPVNFADLKSFAEDKGKYKSLHSYIQHYNERNTEDKLQFSNVFPYLRQSRGEEIINLEDKPLIIGFKHQLDKITKRTTTLYDTEIVTIHDLVKNKRNMQNSKILKNHETIIANNNTRNVKIRHRKKNNSHGISNNDINFSKVMKNENIIINETEYFEKGQMTQYDNYKYSQEAMNTNTEEDILWNSNRSTFTYTESLDEEPYNYEQFRLEYEQQIEYNINKTLSYIKKKKYETTPKEVLKEITNLTISNNCTMEQIGNKTIKCFPYDYQRPKVAKTVDIVMLKIWLVLKIWLLIYICLAIPCWCQRGWCCCCFRCKFCFPRERILFAKTYYTKNPPGILTKDLKKGKEVKEIVKYEAMEYEYDVYNKLESMIKNI